MDLIRESPQPLYQQVEEALRDNIRSGRWPHHYKLKPEGVLAEELGIARGTVRQAIRSLVAEGLLVQVRGKGTFVTAGRDDLPLAQRLVTMHEVLAESGLRFRTEVLLKEVTDGPSRVRSLLDLEDAERLLCLRRRLVVDDEPFVALVNYIRLSLCPGLQEVDFEREPLFASIERCGLTIGWGQRNFAATRAGERAELLGTTPDEPVLYLEQVTYLADQRPLEYSDVWVRGEKLRVTTLLRR